MRKKNKSFVEIKSKNKNMEDNFENIINPLKKYEYVEKKKKLPLKNILIVIFIIMALLLIILLLKLIDAKNNQITTNIEHNTTKQTKDEQLSLLTTTTSNINTNTDEITESLTCSSSNIEKHLKIDTIIVTNFHNQKLRTDINKIHITLLDENFKEEFDNYISILQMFSLYLLDKSNYEITSEENNNEYEFSIKTTYLENQQLESNLSYDEDYNSVKQKLMNLGHTCQ